jgi:hypothetical protein
MMPFDDNPIFPLMPVRSVLTIFRPFFSNVLDFRLAHLLLIIGSGIVAIPIILGVFGILRRRWSFLMISLALLSLYMACLSGAVASGFAYFDQLRPTLDTDIQATSNPVWLTIRSTYNCTQPTCAATLEDAMYNNKQRIGIISAVFLLFPVLTSIMIILHMRRDILYFK